MDEPQLDCRDCIDRLYEYLDDELTPQLARAVRDHLAECAACFPRFQVEGAFLAFLRARVRAKGMPAEARRRLVRDILAGEPPPNGADR